MKYAVGFMRLNCSAENMWYVSSVSGTCTLIRSAAAQQLVELDHLDHRRLTQRRVVHVADVRVVGDDRRLEGQEQARQQRADVAQSDDADGLVPQLEALGPLEHGRPDALVQVGVGLVRLAQQGDGVAYGQLGYGVAVATRRVEDLQPAAVEIRQVEAIHADRTDRHHAQLSGFGEQLVVDLESRPAEQRAVRLQQLAQLVGRLAAGVGHLEAAVAHELERIFVDGGYHQDI